MIVAGVMSGTSADGIDVAVVNVRGSGFKTRFELVAHRGFAYPANVRRFILSAMNAGSASVADLSRLNVLLGELYADCVAEVVRSSAAAIELVGCHGQTLYHQGRPQSFLGRKITTTWQTGEASRIASRLGVPVVSDFRPADMSAGGQGAPLVPFLDYLLYRNRLKGRIAQNIGGIGNLTIIPAGASPEDVLAFDTGPGNMIIDALMESLYHRRFDRGGAVAASGKVLPGALRRALANSFFAAKPPKSAGREQFGDKFVRRFIALCGDVPRADIIATATALTSASIVQAVLKNVRDIHSFDRFIVAGGGTNNLTLMRWLAAELEVAGSSAAKNMRRSRLRVCSSEEFGLPAAAKEAAAFAILAYETWQRRPGNVRSATGARRPVVLGKIAYD